MKKYILLFLLFLLLVEGNHLKAQTADGGIFSSGTTLTVRFRPSADITGAFTGGNFGIRWLSSLGAGVNLSGETGSFGYINQGPKATSGSYDYIVFASGNNIASTTYLAGIEYTLMSITVSGGVGNGTFELCPGGFAFDAGQWYIELGGADRANPNPALWYYQSSASDVPLPVELSSFTSKLINDKVQLNWQTKTEVSNYGFNVEKSLKGGEWSTIGFVEGYGNSNSTKHYSFSDKDLFAGGSEFRYRLKQIDTDGKFEYSDVVAVTVIPTQFELAQNYPNPFNPTTTIRFSLPQSAQVKLNVYNLLGQQIATIAEGLFEQGFHKVEFNADNLSSGAYIYRLESADPSTGSRNGQAGQSFVQTKKMVLIK